MVMPRRAVLLAGAAALVRPTAAALPVPQGDSLAFRMIRHGSDIGRHTLTFDRQGDTLTIHVAVDALVTLLSIPIVRYRHRVVEVWQAGSLLSLTGETDKNGQHEKDVSLCRHFLPIQGTHHSMTENALPSLLRPGLIGFQ